MEIPKPPLNEITEDIYSLALEKYVAINQYDDFKEQVIEANLKGFRGGYMSLYENARLVALWLYGEIRINQVFTEEFLQKLVAENELDVKDLKEAGDQSGKLNKKLAEQRALRAKEFVLASPVIVFWQNAKKEFANNRRDGQSLEDAGKEYLRALISFKRKAGMDLQPDKKTEQSNHPFGEGNNF